MSDTRAMQPLLRTLAAVAALGWASACRADFQVEIYEDNKTPVYFTGSASGGTITIPGGSNSTAFPDFNLSGLTVTSTHGTTANLTLSAGTITPSSAGHTLTILASDSGFTFPVSPSYTLRSTEGYSIGFTNAADTYSYQSYATPGAVLFGTGTASPGHTFSLASNGGFSSGSNTETPTAFLSTMTTNTLTFKAVYSAATAGGAYLQPTGSTTLNAVPEPTSMALMGLGAAGAGLILRRRRRDR